MKSPLKIFSLLVIGALFGVSAVAFAESPDGFKDADEFEDWYAEAAYSMYEEDVITGYDDGTFRAYNTVNRAELTVILDRYTQKIVYEKMDQYFSNELTRELMDILAAEAQMEDFEFDSPDAEAAVIMAEAGLKQLDYNPFGIDGISGSDLEESPDWALPDGYSAFWYNTEGGESYSRFYLNYEGRISSEDTVENFSAWYGPFYILDPDKL